jgi:ABC-type lipoprotein export system ATPase subunit
MILVVTHNEAIADIADVVVNDVDEKIESTRKNEHTLRAAEVDW